MDSCLKNISPKEAIKFLGLHGFIFGNREGSHCTYFKKLPNRTIAVQVIDNNKTCYEKNTRTMIRRSEIPEVVWANYKAIIKNPKKYIKIYGS